MEIKTLLRELARVLEKKIEWKSRFLNQFIKYVWWQIDNKMQLTLFFFKII